MIYTDSDQSDAYTTEEIKDISLNDKPEFLVSMAGNPYVNKLDRAIDSAENMFVIEKILRPTFNVVFGGGVGKKTFQHGLGYRPKVIGSYYFKSIGNHRIIGDFPARQFAVDGSLWIDDTTNKDVIIGYNIPDDLGPSSPNNDDIVMKLFILKNEII